MEWNEWRCCLHVLELFDCSDEVHLMGIISWSVSFWYRSDGIYFWIDSDAFWHTVGTKLQYSKKHFDRVFGSLPFRIFHLSFRGFFSLFQSFNLFRRHFPANPTSYTWTLVWSKKNCVLTRVNKNLSIPMMAFLMNFSFVPNSKKRIIKFLCTTWKHWMPMENITRDLIFFLIS